MKRIRTGKSGLISYQRTTEPEGMVDAPVETLLKQILKGVNQPAAAPVIIPPQPLSTTGLKKELKTPIPSTSGFKKKKTPKPFSPFEQVTLGKTPLSSKKKAPISDRGRRVLKSLGIDYDDGSYSPKGKSKKYKKAKPSAAEKLQAGWEDFEDPWRRGLDYDSD